MTRKSASCSGVRLASLAEIEQERALDMLLSRTSAAVQESLDAQIDVPQRLRDLLREAGIEPAPSQPARR